jgi:hypothetical protein
MARGLMSMKNSIDIIGNRKHNRPACSAVPQPTALSHKGKVKDKGKSKNKGSPGYASVANRKTRIIAHLFLQMKITEASDQLRPLYIQGNKPRY